MTVKKHLTESWNEGITCLVTFSVFKTLCPKNNIMRWIFSAANSFIVNDGHGRKAVIAGYHWYEPWAARYVHFLCGSYARDRSVSRRAEHIGQLQRTNQEWFNS